MLNEAIGLLNEQVDVKSKESDWGFESVLLEQSELDAELLPEDYFQILPKVVLVHTYMYQDVKATDYVAYFITDESNQHEYIRGLLKNGQLIWSNTKRHFNEGS